MNTNFFRVNMASVGHWLQLLVLNFGLILTIGIAVKLRLPDFDWQIALNGWSPIDWVAHMRFPERYALDFRNGMELYDKSSSMHIYLLVNRWFEVPVERVIPVVIFLEMIFLAGACIFFARTLSTTASPVGQFLFALLVVVSPARDLDLSNFGAPFFWGLYYNFADGFRLLGLAFFMRRKPLIGGLLLGVGFSIHPIMAIFACAFVVGFVAVERNWVTFKSLVLGILTFLVISGAWLCYTYDFSSIVSTKVDPQVWTRMVRAFSYHFFPLDYGLLTLDFHKRLLPLLVLCLLSLHYLPTVVVDRSLRRGLIGGSLVLVALIVIGLLISLYLPIPSLIKLALPRASALFILVSMAICCIGLVHDIQHGTVFQRLLSLLIVVSPFAYPPAFIFVPVALLILLSRSSTVINMVTKYRKVVIGVMALALAAIFACWFLGFVQLHKWHTYMSLFLSFGSWNLVVVCGIFLVCLWAISMDGHRFSLPKTQMKEAASSLGPAAVFILVCFLGFAWQRSLVPDQDYRTFGKSYLDAQRWAKSNTPEQSYFMVDPTISYGWRDFSERSSFGNLREWVHTSWLYDSREDTYTRGMQRFSEFGIELNPYLDLPVSHLQGYHKLSEDVGKRFYDLNEEWFSSKQQSYGVTHVVMKKSEIHQNYQLKKAYENQHFVIFELYE